MTKTHRIAGFTLALSSALWHTLPAAGQPIPAGRVLVLESAQVLEGNIERIGDQYRVQYPVGETWVPAGQVLRLCVDMADAYAFLRGQANLGDPDEHLRLARWCRAHGLHSPAVVEVTQALELRPGHADSQHLLECLQRDEEQPPPANRTAPEPEPASAAALEFNTESLGLFVTRVQPILMNACANCHATGRGGLSFKLMRAYTNELTSRRATQQNLAAVLSQVNRKQPEMSALLSRAVAVHGEATQPPLKSRQVPAFKILEEWVQLALANEPREAAPSVAFPEPKNNREPDSSAATFATIPSTPQTVEGARQPSPNAPSDPFDPTLFNQQAHPPAPEGQPTPAGASPGNH